MKNVISSVAAHNRAIRVMASNRMILTCAEEGDPIVSDENESRVRGRPRKDAGAKA